MNIFRTTHFKREFRKFPAKVKRAFNKQAAYLAQDIRHPSLRSKKYDEATAVWQARVTGTVRFYFRIEGDTYRLLNIRNHPK